LICSSDQRGNAPRVVFHDLGIKEDIKDTENEIEIKVEKILNEGTFKSNVTAFKNKGLQNEGFERGLEFIKEYIKSSSEKVVNKKK
jgi:hypothetical protein